MTEKPSHELPENALRESQRQLATLLSNLPGMAYRCLQKQNWPMEFVSQGSLALTGYEPSHFINDAFPRFADLIHPDDRRMVWERVEESVRKREQFVLEYRIHDKAGRERWVFDQGLAIETVGESSVVLEGFILDITHRKNMEKALRKSTEQQRFLADIIERTEQPIGVKYPGGHPRTLNRAFCNLTGYTFEELQTENKLELLTPPEWRPAAAAALAELDRTGRPVRYEKEYIRKDGSRVPVELFVHGARDRSGRTKYYNAFITDISHRKRAEKERRVLEEQLIHAQRMESVGRLAGGVAHDYNNMLGIIMGYAEMILENMDPLDPLRPSISQILWAAKRSVRITRQLLAFARRQTAAPLVLDLNTSVESMHGMLRQLIGEDIDFIWNPMPDRLPVKMDPSQIDQILANLCVNARDAIDNVGKITVETDRVIFDAAYCAVHAGFVAGEYAMLAVSDNGCGMDRKTLDKIFEPFFTTKTESKGTGLGLATVYGIVKQNNGFVNVYSEPGQGTTFKIYLPVHEGQTEDAPPREEGDLPGGHGDLVLVVEDEASILKLADAFLRELGYRVFSAQNPIEALNLAEAQPDNISLLITDVILPDMNGRELARRLRLRFPGLECLYMSGYTANVIAHHGVLEEGIYFLQKPFSKKQLALKVRSVLESKQAQQP